MLHTATTQPIYNSSSTGGSSLQLNSSYNYPPSATSYHQSGKFGTLNGPLNGSPNLMLNQSLTNVAPLSSLTSSTMNCGSIPTKRVMFVGDTPQTIGGHTSALTNPDAIQLLPAHGAYPPSAYAPSLGQPVYNQDLNVTDVYYGALGNATLQAPMKLPRLNYHMSNSRISLNNSLNNHQFTSSQFAGNQFANTLANQQPANQQYFPVVSSRNCIFRLNISICLFRSKFSVSISCRTPP